MKKSNLYLLCSAVALTISACSNVNQPHSHDIDENYINDFGSFVEPIDIVTNFDNEKPHDEYREGVVLVKAFEEIDFDSIDLKISGVEELYPGSFWKKIELKEGTSFDAVQYLRSINVFDKVDYDYIMKKGTEYETINVSDNTYADDLPYIDSMGIGHAWGHYKHHHDDSDGGGSPNTIIAIIDTGVDYNHLDLRDNIWVNAGEIANNGIDDDNNGYVDDVRGWDCVNEDNDPNDDNGHGTHVAGIAAAENNNIGTVGVAFNCKIMPIKAGNSSGYFNNADIAQAIQYAYMNGASVINMSFGGSSISLAVEEALEAAYLQSVLVAAAGNDGLCNQPYCPYCVVSRPSYPAALPYVVGVMSCNNDGSSKSAFSNFDHAPFHYNQFEYDCYACGEQIISTWPNNKYAQLSGTSMSAPVVSGIAALLRSEYPDKETYTTKYLNSQLSNTGTVFPSGDVYHPLCDAYEAVSKVPAPHIYNVYNYYAFDNVELSTKNNGDGFIDAGETIRLGIELQNRGGKATNVTAKIDTIRGNDPNLTDPNVDITTDTIHMDEIGTFSIRDGGKIYDGSKIVDMENAFVIDISENAPNGYICDLNLNISYYNGLENDGIEYHGECEISIEISSGVRLSGLIDEDTVFTSDRLYIIDDIVTIKGDITVEFEAGSKIQFFDTNSGMIDTALNTPGFNVYGTLNFNGTIDNKITLKPSETRRNYLFKIIASSFGARINFDYCDIINMTCDAPTYEDTYIHVCHSNISYDSDGMMLQLVNGESRWANGIYLWNLDDCILDLSKNPFTYMILVGLSESLFYCGSPSFSWEPSNSNVSIYNKCINNVFACPNGEFSYGNVSVTICANTSFNNNAYVTDFIPKSLSRLANFDVGYVSSSKDNYLCDLYKEYGDRLFINNYKEDGSQIVNINSTGNFDPDLVFPFVKNVMLEDKDGNATKVLNAGINKVTVEFSRAIDQDSDFQLFFGSSYPYKDYLIDGSFISDTVWEGTFEIKTTIEGGKQCFSSRGGYAQDNPFYELTQNIGSFTFDIDSSSALSMNLQAVSTDNGIELTWVQDDYETLMGYNIYRSTEKDGYYSRINPSVIPSDENTYIDDSCEPGRNYWYTFTVVLSDFSESAPAGKINATAKDTVSPSIYHNPVNQGYEGTNLIINCSISDNINVQSATVHYRIIGEEEWKTVSMSKANDRFSAIINGNDVTLSGLQYYITATDGFNVAMRGSAETPFTVVVKSSASLNGLGDVDGDGVITTKDALMIMQAINGDLLLSDDEFKRADLNKDGLLSSVEALRILQYINGNVQTLDM